MVDGEPQDVVFVFEADQRGAKQRVPREVEWTTCLLSDQSHTHRLALGGLTLPEVVHRQRERLRIGHRLTRCAVDQT